MKSYILNVLAVFSVLLNTITGGSHRNTFSARVGYSSNILGSKWAKIMEKIINTLFWFDSNHCYSEYVQESTGTGGGVPYVNLNK